MSGPRSKRWAMISALVVLLVAAGIPALLPSTAAAEVLETHSGIVFDVHGKPVRDAIVTMYRQNNYMGGYEVESTAVTDKDGLFSVWVRTWTYGVTYYYMTFAAEKYVEVRAPEGEALFTETRCEVCTPDPMTVVMGKAVWQ